MCIRDRFDDCAFLKDWPGIPVGNEEGEIISAAIGDKRALLLSHHGQLVVGTTVEEACVLAILFERAAKMQLLALASGDIKPIPQKLGSEAHDWFSTEKRNQTAFCLLYTSPSPRDRTRSRMPSSA